LKKNVHVPGLTHKQSNKEDAPEAQAPSSCKRDEHSARTTLDSSQHTKTSRCRVHNSVFKKGAAIYNDHTAIIKANNPPILEAERCDHTGLWKLPLHAEDTVANKEPPHNEAINIILDLPSACQNFLCYHAVAGFPPKETFIRDICIGNYAMWPKLTVQLIHKYMPDLDKTAKGHLKGQHQEIRSTKKKKKLLKK
jgi:hypothetical protein